MSRTPRHRSTAALALALALGAAACGDAAEATGDATTTTEAAAPATGGEATTTTAEPVEEVTIRVAAAAPNPTHIGFWLAEAAGYFDEAGIQIELIQTQGAAAVLQGLLNDEVDLGLFSLTTALQATAQGRTLQVIAGLSDTAFDAPVVRAGFLEDQGIDPATFLDLPLEERLAALRGSRWTISGAGSLTDAKIRYIAGEAGLDPDRDIRIDVIGNNAEVATIQAIEGGTLDVTFFDRQVAEPLLEAGTVVRLLDPENADELPIIQNALLTQVVVDADWAAAHADVARRIAGAVARANQEFHDSTSAEVAAIIQPEFAELSLEDLELALEAVRPIVPEDSRIPRSVIEANIELALLHGTIQDAPDPDAVYTEQYLP